MTTPFNFLGIPEIKLNQAQVIVLPVPFESSTSYGQGTKNGPKAIIEASCQVELFDPEFGDEMQELVKIHTVSAAKGGLKTLANTAAKYQDKFLISLGGEHSITPEIIKPLLKKYPDLSILQIDAHSDMREKYEGNKNSHACAMRRAQELGIKQIIQVGIRNSGKDEQQFINPENIFWGNKFNIKDVMKKLSKNVYLTFDVDGLDSSVMPATGTPEPGGLSYEQALELLKAVAREKNLVGADFVELSPIKLLPAYDFVIAKLIYKLIGYKFIS